MLAQESAALTDMPVIPAMTTDAERACYYRLVKEGAHRGAVVELGAWLGASSAYIAAAMRDSGTGKKAHVFDRFVSKIGHADKVKAFFADRARSKPIPIGPALEQFKANLGPLMDYIKPHRGEIAQIEWTGGPISVLISDAPKRVPQISAVLTRLREALVPGSIMAWQDFCHFPSYEIAACLYRLGDHIEFVEAVVPGTTLVFRVKEQWAEAEVSPEEFDLRRWTPGAIADAWDYWLRFVPAEKAALFRCGAAMFLCGIGSPTEAVKTLAAVLDDDAEAVMPKWRYLAEKRPDFRKRYAPLFKLTMAEA